MDPEETDVQGRNRASTEGFVDRVTDGVLDRLKELTALTPDEEDQVARLAAVGLMPRDIAVAMEWPRERRRAFCLMADCADTEISDLIAAGRAMGRVQPQMKLQEAAAAGNVEAVKALQGLQAANRFAEQLTLMDDDEFTL